MRSSGSRTVSYEIKRAAIAGGARRRLNAQSDRQPSVQPDLRGLDSPTSRQRSSPAAKVTVATTEIQYTQKVMLKTSFGLTWPQRLGARPLVPADPISDPGESAAADVRVVVD